MNYLLSMALFASVLASPLFGQSLESDQEEHMTISSGEAEYNGQEITLTGQVVVEHSLGKISAHRLTVLPSIQPDKKSRFSLLKMKDAILIELHDGGQLACQEAEIDYLELTGTFFGNQQHPDVIYRNRSELNREGKHMQPLLIVKSYEMQAELVRQRAAGVAASKTLVQKVLANRHVRVYYNQEYLLLADHAIYQRLPSDELSTAGLLTLSAREEHPYCLLTNTSGDRIQAQTIVIDTAKKELHLADPKGTLSVQKTDKPSQAIQFSADTLAWRDAEQLLKLQGHVNIKQEGMIQIETDHEVNIQQAWQNDRKKVRSIFSPQDTVLIYQDSKKELTHKILCYGNLTIDNEQLVTTLDSPKGDDGLAMAGKQVYLEGALGDMYADRVRLYYEALNGRAPTKIVLEGHVKMLNRFDGHFQETSSILQYALADHVEYLPDSQEIILSGQKGNRVLFFDKVNNMQMSAPSLKIRRDEKNQKSSIQGVGDVRFTFIEKELDQLRQRFSLDGNNKQEGP